MTWFEQRPKKWSSHDRAPRDVILFNYYLRRRPKHILNLEMRVYSDNFYGITPRDGLSPYCWLAALNSTISAVGILANARNQGSGLAKLQLFEYRDSLILDIRKWSRHELDVLESFGRELAEQIDKIPS